MRYFYLLTVLLFYAGCNTASESNFKSNVTDSSYFGNVSFLLGNEGKNTVDSNGVISASNIYWKDSLGNLTTLQDLRGNVVVLNFFATWCGFCNREMPWFKLISDSLASKVRFIAVSVDDGDSTYSTLTYLKTYADRRGINFQIISDPHQRAYNNYGAKDAIPWTFIIDRHGYVIHSERGMFDSLKVITDIIDKIP